MTTVPKAKFSAHALQTRIDRGDGAGHGPLYLPFMTSESAPNAGHSGKYKCPLTGRYRHFLSETEEGATYGAMRDRNVTEVRENLRLPIALTEKICRKLGIKHPISSGEGTPLHPFTTDIVVVRTVPPVYIAIGAKTRPKFSRWEHWRSLLVEHIAWNLLGVPYFVVTDLEVGKNRRISLQFIHPRGALPNGEWSRDEKEFLEVARATDWSASLLEVVREISNKLGIDSAVGLEIFKRLAWAGELKVDLSRGIGEHTRNAVRK